PPAAPFCASGTSPSACLLRYDCPHADLEDDARSRIVERAVMRATEREDGRGEESACRTRNEGRRSWLMTEQRNEELSFLWRDITVTGTLPLPPSPPPHPAVLMLQGAGPAGRDSGGYFPPIRDAFLSRGIAAFSFDKPGIGGSSGNWRQYALMDRADQA